MNPSEMLVMIKGGGDLATGVAARLHRAGFPVVITELPQPLMVRRTVAFGEAVYDGEVMVEGIRARLAANAGEASSVLACLEIPVLVDPHAQCVTEIGPTVLVDAIMAKQNTGTSISDAPTVIALGPGFTAGSDCHAVIETNRGHRLGRAIYHGSAEPDTGSPGNIGGLTEERILRAPAAGAVQPKAVIGDRVSRGQLMAVVAGHEVRAGTAGVLRGMVRRAVLVSEGEKIGDVDPRAEPEHCLLISDKALAIAGGVLEAILRCAGRADGR